MASWPQVPKLTGGSGRGLGGVWEGLGGSGRGLGGFWEGGSVTKHVKRRLGDSSFAFFLFHDDFVVEPDQPPHPDAPDKIGCRGSQAERGMGKGDGVGSRDSGFFGTFVSGTAFMTGSTLIDAMLPCTGCFFSKNEGLPRNWDTRHQPGMCCGVNILTYLSYGLQTSDQYPSVLGLGLSIVFPDCRSTSQRLRSGSLQARRKSRVDSIEWSGRSVSKRRATCLTQPKHLSTSAAWGCLF